MLNIKSRKKLMIPILALILVVAMSSSAFAESFRLYSCTGNGVAHRGTASISGVRLGLYYSGNGALGKNPAQIAYGDGYAWTKLLKSGFWGWSVKSYFSYIRTVY